MSTNSTEETSYLGVTIGFAVADALFAIIFVWLCAYSCKHRFCAADYGSDLDSFDKSKSTLNYLKKKTGKWSVPYDELTFGKILGKGSQGEVFRAVWRGSAVAVKKIDTRIVAPEIIEEFCQEAEIMRQLRHPCLTLFMGISLENPHLCIITEIVERGSLFDIMHDEHSALSWKNCLRVAADVAQGMTYLHSHNPPILHRDLKSLNILVDGTWRGKVADFGMSRFQTDGTMTQCGSPLWMAPEMIRNEAYDDKADVYSFGICLWEMYVRKIPYRSLNLNPSQLVVKVVRENIRPPIPRSCPRPFAKMMQKCWHPAAVKRPPFASIVNVLNAFLVDPLIYQHQPGAKDKQAAVVEEVAAAPAVAVPVAAPKVEDWKIDRADIVLGDRIETAASSQVAAGLPPAAALGSGSDGIEAELLSKAMKTRTISFSLPRAGNDWFRATFRGAEVAVKRCLLEKDVLRKENARILELMKLTAVLRHPNVLLCMGSYIDAPNSEVGIMTEVMRHHSLRSVLANPAITIDWDQNMQMMIDAAAGLAFLHGVPLVHEDVSTLHLFVDSNWRVKVSNCTFVDLNAMLTNQPQTCSVMDAPEILREPKTPRTLAANVYSFALVLLEISLRQPVYREPLTAEFAQRVIAGQRPELPTRVMATLRHVIELCWNSNPQQRPNMARVTDELTLIKKAGPPAIVLTPGVNAKLYVKKTTVFAYRSKDPVTIMKDWGKSAGVAGCYVISAGDGDAYTISADVLRASYEPVAGSDHEYRKIGTVLAREMTEPFALKKGDNIENGRAGDFVVQNDKKEQWLVEEAKFRQLYMEMPSGNSSSRPPRSGHAGSGASGSGSGNGSTAPRMKQSSSVSVP